MKGCDMCFYGAGNGVASVPRLRVEAESSVQMFCLMCLILWVILDEFGYY